jgi:glycosyltransferase involved in cell wall biosynthesis
MKLLHVLSSANPDGGGPVEGVLRRGLHLHELGHRVEIVTLDDPNLDFVREFPLNIHALGPSRGRYRYNRRLVPWLRIHAAEYDAVIINGLWQYHSFAAGRILKKMGLPYFVFAHGMLDPWFKRTYPLKHLKKWLYWPWADYRVLRDARAVLFTSEEERLQARRSFWLYRAEEVVVAYGTTPPPENSAKLREHFLAVHPSLQGRRVMLFLSRIHEKKGCDLLIEAFARVASIDRDLQLVMAGPDQTGWVARLKSLAQQHGVAERITWPGMLKGELKWGAFCSAEVFTLPSHQENFGIAVAEALGCGLPVLISDKVNIWREIRSHQAGLVAPDTLAGTERLLREWLSLSPAERRAMGESARGLFRRRFTVEAMATGLLDVVNRGSGVLGQEARQG